MVDQPVAAILQQVETQYEVTFNYNVDILPATLYSFSLEGSLELVLNDLSNILERSIVPLGANNYTIKRRHTPTESHGEREISLRIIDGEGQSISFAIARIFNIDWAAVANDDGRINIQGYIAATDTVHFESLGFAKRSIQIKDLENRKSVVLSPSNEELAEVVIIDDRSLFTDPPSLSMDDVRTIGSSTDNDVLSILQNEGGIFNPSENFQDLLLRGGSPDQVQYNWNNIQIYQNSHFFGKISSINPILVDKIQIDKGGYSSSNTGGVSGALNFSNSTYKGDHLQVHANLLFTNIGGHVSLFKDRLNVRAAFRHSHPGNWNNGVQQSFLSQTFQFGRLDDLDFFYEAFGISDFFERTSTISFYDGGLSLNYQLSKKTELSVDYIKINNSFTHESVSEEFVSREIDQLDQKNEGRHVRLQHNWNDHFHSSLDYSRTKYTYDYESFDTMPAPQFLVQEQRNHLDQAVFKFNQGYKNRDITLDGGVTLKTWDVSAKDETFDVNFLEYENDTKELAFYLEGTMDLGRLYVQSGINYSNYNKGLDNRKILDPRIGLTYTAHPHLRLTANYRHAHQYLNRRNLFTPLQADNGFWFISDEQDFDDFIHIIQSRQASVGWEWWSGSWRISNTLYGKKTKDVWTSIFDFTIDENPYRFGDVETLGSELHIQFEKENTQFSLNYDYVYERIDLDDRGKANSPFSQPHQVRFGFGQRIKKWTLGLDWALATGRPFSRATGLEEVVDDNGDVGPSVVYADLLENRVRTYHRLDASVRYGTSFGGGSELTIGAQLGNVYDQRNVIKNQYFISYREDPAGLGFLERLGLGRTANVFVEIRF